MTEVLDSQQFLGACAAIFVVDLQELQLNHQVCIPKVRFWLLQNESYL